MGSSIEFEWVKISSVFTWLNIIWIGIYLNMQFELLNCIFLSENYQNFLDLIQFKMSKSRFIRCRNI